MGFEPVGDGSDDDAFVAPTCPQGVGPWSLPARVPGLMDSVLIEFGPHPATDGLRLYFDRGPDADAGQRDIWLARRPDRSSAFVVDATAIPDLSVPFAPDGNPTLTPDELEIYFQSARSGLGCLYTSSRTSTTTTWSAPVMLPWSCSPETDGPHVSTDRLRLYYSTRDAGFFTGVIMMSSRLSSDDVFPAGVPVAGIPTAPRAGFPSLSPDELTIYYESEDSDLHFATRLSRADAFGNAMLVPNTMANFGQADAAISPDGLELFYASDELQGGQHDLFQIRRTCL